MRPRSVGYVYQVSRKNKYDNARLSPTSVDNNQQLFKPPCFRLRSTRRALPRPSRHRTHSAASNLSAPLMCRRQPSHARLCSRYHIVPPLLISLAGWTGCRTTSSPSSRGHSAPLCMHCLNIVSEHAPIRPLQQQHPNSVLFRTGAITMRAWILRRNTMSLIVAALLCALAGCGAQGVMRFKDAGYALFPLVRAHTTAATHMLWGDHFCWT